ncbi:MAG TPA: DinB family protein [Thermoanaerobaculia bacterium]|jgi:hypothetical protein
MSYNAAERENFIRRYEEGPRTLRAALAKVPPEAMKWRPGENKWSAHEVAIHCADSETNAAARIRFLATEESPMIQGYDEAEWARRLDYHALPIEPALATVDAVRANTTALLRRLPESVWSSEGKHTQSGKFSAERWLEVYAEHLEKHSRQVERNLEAWKARGH